MWYYVEEIAKWIVLVMMILLCGIMIGLIGNIGIMWYLLEYLNIPI